MEKSLKKDRRIIESDGGFHCYFAEIFDSSKWRNRHVLRNDGPYLVEVDGFEAYAIVDGDGDGDETTSTIFIDGKGVVSKLSECDRVSKEVS